MIDATAVDIVIVVPQDIPSHRTVGEGRMVFRLSDRSATAVSVPVLSDTGVGCYTLRDTGCLDMQGRRIFA